MNLLNLYPNQKINLHHSSKTRVLVAPLQRRSLPIWLLFVGFVVSIALWLLLAQSIYASGGTTPTFALCYDGIEGGDNGVQISGTVDGSQISANARAVHVTLDGVDQSALSIDLYRSADTSKCSPNATPGITPPKVTCALNTYSLDALANNNNTTELTALQAAIWHFSDDFNLAEAEPVYARYQQIVDDVNSRFDTGQCDLPAQWQMHVTPTSAIYYLEPFSATAYKSKTHELQLVLYRGDQPVGQQQISVSTDVGTLSWNGQTGAAVTVETDFDGTVDIAIRHDNPAVANISLSTDIEVSPGTRVDAGPNDAKFVLSGIANHPLQAQANVEWRAGSEIAVRKFRDRNGDGEFNLDDSLISSQIEVCESGTATCNSYQINVTGLLVIDVEPAKLYDVCTVAGSGYQATTAECISSVSASSALDFGVQKLPALLIESYHDLNGDGQFDEDDQLLDGWPFQVARWFNNRWVSTYSGSTSYGGRYAVSSSGLQSLQVMPQMPQNERWYASSGQSRTISLFEQKLYTATFGSIQPASMVVNQFWEKDGVLLDAAPTATIFCLRRTGPGVPRQELVPMVGLTPMVQNESGSYCYDSLINTITVDNLWPGDYEVQHRPPDGWGNSVLSPSLLSLPSGREYRSVRAVNNIRTGLFSGRAWNDVNRNGLRDNGELGIPGLLVHLYATFPAEDGETEPDSTLFQVTSTDGEGKYRFEDLLPGDYFIEFQPLESYITSGANLGGSSAESYDSDADPVTGRTPIKLLSNGAVEANWDIGLYLNSGTYSFKHLINGQDADLLSYAVSVTPSDLISFTYVLQNNSATPLVWDNLADDANGDLSAACNLPREVLPTASVTCEVVRQAGTFPDGKLNTGVASVAGFGNATDPAWYVTAPPTRIGGIAWADTDQDGIRGSSEPGISNVNVELFFGNGQPTGRKTMTGANGVYKFDNLAPQAYFVQFLSPEGYFYTQPRQGADTGRDSDANQMTDNIRVGRTNSIQLGDDEVNETIGVGLLILPARLWSISLGSNGMIGAGKAITYTINYVNHGYSQAYAVEIVETVPAGTTANLAQSTPGWSCTDGNVTAGTECVLPVGDVAGSSATNSPVTFVVNVNDDVMDENTQISNDVKIRDDGRSDPYPDGGTQGQGNNGGTVEPPAEESGVDLFLPLITQN